MCLLPMQADRACPLNSFVCGQLSTANVTAVLQKDLSVTQLQLLQEKAPLAL